LIIYHWGIEVYENIDSFTNFSRKFTAVDDEGRNRLVKAALCPFETQKYIKNADSSKTKDPPIGEEGAHREKRRKI
jgi:hypothetical protein